MNTTNIIIFYSRVRLKDGEYLWLDYLMDKNPGMEPVMILLIKNIIKHFLSLHTSITEIGANRSQHIAKK